MRAVASVAVPGGRLLEESALGRSVPHQPRVESLGSEHGQDYDVLGFWRKAQKSVDL